MISAALEASIEAPKEGGGIFAAPKPKDAPGVPEGLRKAKQEAGAGA